MSKIENAVNEAIEKHETSGRSDRDRIRRLTDFSERMKERGLVTKKKYSLPPMDTVGRTAYREK